MLSTSFLFQGQALGILHENQGLTLQLHLDVAFLNFALNYRLFLLAQFPIKTYLLVSSSFLFHR